MTALVLLLALAPQRPEPALAQTLASAWVRCRVRGPAVEGLTADGAGRSRSGLVFAREIRPRGWDERPDTRLERTDGATVTVGPLDVRVDRTLAVPPGAETAADLLQPGHVFGQTFRVPEGAAFTYVTVDLPTWHTTDSEATLTLKRGEEVVVSRRLTRIRDNATVRLDAPSPMGPGEYAIELSEPKGMVGWWSKTRDFTDAGDGIADGRPIGRDRVFSVDLRALAGTGRVTYSLHGQRLSCAATMRPTGDPGGAVEWLWSASWTKAGYDCTPKAGVVFDRWFTDNQRYMPAQQLKRRDEPGLSFAGARWIEMEGTRDADLRVEGAGLSLGWRMATRELTMRIGVPFSAAGEERRSAFTVVALPRADSVPESFPRFAFPDARLTQDVNRFWWERAFTYPAPAGPAAWLAWMPVMRGWFAGPAREGEKAQVATYPITPEGYVHTWGETVGWPFPPGDYDTRHFDTNARYIVGAHHLWRWTGDDAFLRSQADRLRRAMRYQLDTLKGSEGLLVAASKDVNGRHKGVGNNYWDILPFGHLDAYANAVWFASIGAMAEMERALGGEPLTDYGALARRVRERYDAVFWDEEKGRYIGCVDVDGARHDYGFTFVNLEALAYGLGDSRKARRIYRWMETEPTSSGKADTYSRWVFAPRANTLHNPMWGENAPKSERESPTPPWWHFGWLGTPYGDQCQDGGAILYTSYFDLMARQRHLGPDNAWRRFLAIVERYRMPDRLCGGPPLARGEIPQQENPGQVGVDLPFPESGLVPCWLLYGVMGVEATPAGLRIRPALPAALPWIEARGIDWHGWRLRIRCSRTWVGIEGRGPAGQTVRRTYRIRPGQGFLFRP